MGQNIRRRILNTGVRLPAADGEGSTRLPIGRVEQGSELDVRPCTANGDPGQERAVLVLGYVRFSTNTAHFPHTLPAPSSYQKKRALTGSREDTRDATLTLELDVNLSITDARAEYVSGRIEEG